MQTCSVFLLHHISVIKLVQDGVLFPCCFHCQQVTNNRITRYFISAFSSSNIAELEQGKVCSLQMFAFSQMVPEENM